MKITVNGISEEIAAEDIEAYIRARGIEPKTLVVEYNGQVVASGQWAHTALCEGDCLELLSFVGGG